MTVRELESPPGKLPLFGRAAVGAVPGVSKLPVIGGTRGKDVPDLTLALNDVLIDVDRLAAYAHVCGFPLTDTLPVTYPHILAFPLQLSLMTDSSFPFPAMGLVHIYNRITQHRPIKASETLSIRVWATPLEPHPRGTQFSLRSEVRAGDQLVWEEMSTNLRRGGEHVDESASAATVPSAEDLPTVATWKSAIAHGMWTKARCVATLEPRLPQSFTVEVAFKRPILLPATVHFAADAEGTRFGVRDAEEGTPHLDGTLALLPR
jgi:acyl dehydratase